ncbi:hypothetical protein [Paramaledivibacter caminithermalis]|jgi:hypothetical protein|uniref:Uncharacterized protein n=1 Tax=Paramaledivibacter caminithermalis (strain DSM 15212 / CIP 107654 / DViRD3) TaxID=1121301 RepID=A0A1M6MHL5_PARC5|nr:hypothetical protein [Paramaledivibacter caminithermalis]SHJ82947.1 hypothetical protein SAMN02745912_01260 [Paramaledivibacter caminithermalis DSM 15212]
MKKNRSIYYIDILIAIIICTILIPSCAKQAPQKPSPKSDEPKEMPKIVEEMESEIISIMSQIDMVPYYEKQIKEKKKKNEEKKEFALKMGTSFQESSDQDNKGQEGKNAQNKEMSQIDKFIEFEPKPITINDILLSPILKNEETNKKESRPAEIPNDIEFIWEKINKKITGLHEKWNSLESLVIKSGTSQESIDGFEKTLNNLTISANSYNFLDSIFYSNKLTAYIPDLIKNFKKKIPSPIYYMKYHLRQIILDYRINDYSSASNNYTKLNIYKDALISQLIDKKKMELANKLNTSIKDLEDSLKLKDLNIIKIKGSVVISNIELVKEELSK